MIPDWLDQLTRDGFTLLPNVFTPEELQSARESCGAALATNDSASSVLANADGAAYGARNLLRLWPAALDLIRSPLLAAPLLRILGPQAGVVRGLYFDKPPGNSWALPWHRDLTIAVKQHGPLGRFRRPTSKAGVPHVEAPIELLAEMITARIHLDAVTNKNGPLRFIPGSHIMERAIQPGDREAVILNCNAGDVLLMRPLLLHASGHSEPDHPEHRRIVHLELAPRAELPDGFEWQDFVGIDAGAVSQERN